MSERHTMLRSMHDLGLGAWFGGSLMGAVGVNGAAAQVDDSRKRLPIASAGWARWTPINAAAIGTHLVGAAGELVTESPRVATQSGVATMSAVKTALTAAALAATGYGRMLGMKMEHADSASVAGITEPNPETPRKIASAQRQMKVVQWAIPVLTGALIVVTSFAGEQQKPGQMTRGVLARVGGLGKAPKRVGMLAMTKRMGRMAKGRRMGMMPVGIMALRMGKRGMAMRHRMARR